MWLKTILMRKPLLFITSIVCIAIGCKLDDPGILKATGTSSLLINGKWYLKKMSVYNDPYYGSYDTVAFTNKDYYLFKADNSFDYSSTQPDTLINGKYTYSAANKRIIFITPELDTANVVKLTKDSLLLQSEIVASAGGPVTIDKIIYRYAHN
jgi:hypothetical protein